jgi:RND family efflux transporter MFP subunit
LRHDDEYFGHALVVLPVGHPPSDEDLKKLVETLRGVVSGAHMRLLANQDAMRSTARRIQKTWRQWIARRLHWIAAMVGLVLVLPWPHRIRCDVNLEPVSRRYVTAPFEGTLEKTLAKNGDRVRAGDLLATLDGRELRFELAGLEAELIAARKKADLARAQQDIAESQIQKSEARRIEAAIHSIETRLQELEVRCPIDGIVVSGDLDQAEGAKLRVGQTLFEIGPLEQMLVELQIDEHQIRFASVGDPVTVSFKAFPFRTWQGSISKIHSRSEIVNDKNVFIAEVMIPNETGELQPGMHGRAKISNGWAITGWLWFHRAYEEARHWFVF